MRKLTRLTTLLEGNKKGGKARKEQRKKKQKNKKKLLLPTQALMGLYEGDPLWFTSFFFIDNMKIPLILIFFSSDSSVSFLLYSHPFCLTTNIVTLLSSIF